MQRLLGHPVSQLESKLCLIVYSKGISQIGCVAGVIIVITIVAQQGADTRAFGIEIVDTERRLTLNEALLACRIDKCLNRRREVHVTHRVECEERVEIDGISYLTLLGVLLLYKVESNISAEESVVAQYRTCHTATQGRVNLTHQHRCLTECLSHPTGETRVLTAVLIIYPQMPTPRYSIIAATKQRTVRLSSQGCFHLKLRIFQMLNILLVFVFPIVGVGYLCQSHKELVIFGDVFCHRAGSQEK